jgi:hypothetical protein
MSEVAESVLAFLDRRDRLAAAEERAEDAFNLLARGDRVCSDCMPFCDRAGRSTRKR